MIIVGQLAARPVLCGIAKLAPEITKRASMNVKLFWKNQPGRPKAGVFKDLSFGNAQDLESEINAWLVQNPKTKIVDIRQSASGGSFAESLWLISIWYEESA